MRRANGAAPSGQTTSLVRPPRFAEGGGGPLPFGSGAPGMPQPGSPRARQLARQWRDDARGRFTERLFVFEDSGFLTAGETTSPGSSVKVVSNRTSFVRLVAIKGSVSAEPGEGVSDYIAGQTEMAMRLSLQINGEESLTTDGEGTQPAAYSDLFQPTAPWFWFAAPPRLRVSDTLLANWTNVSGVDVFPLFTINASLVARIVDDAWWQALYGT